MVKEVLGEGIQRPKKGHDAGDHPPITPMRCADRAQLDHDSWRLYEYITKHFIGTVCTCCLKSLVQLLTYPYLTWFCCTFTFGSLLQYSTVIFQKLKSELQYVVRCVSAETLPCSLTVACVYFLQLMPDCKYLSTTISISIGQESFSISGKQLIDPGFTKVMLPVLFRF